MAPLMVTISRLRRDHVGELTTSTGRKATSWLLVEPLVEPLAAGREGRDRDAVELPLAVRDLARLVKLHQPGGEHLGVDRRSRRRLPRRASRRSSRGSRRCRSGSCRRPRRTPGRARRSPSRPRPGAGPRGPTARRPTRSGCRCRRGGPRAVYSGGDPVGAAGSASETSTISSRSGSSAARFISATVPPACRERLHQPFVVGGGGGGDHDPRRLLLEERREAAEVGGGEADVRARVAQGPLERAEEAGQVVDAGMVEELGADQQQRAVDPQLLPVGPLAERLQQRRRLPRPERDAQRVARARSGRPPRPR